MPNAFPTTPRAARAVRIAATAIALAALALATRTTLTSTDWIGRVFPGFVLLDNRVVASIGLADWSGTDVPGLYQSEVVAVDGVPIRSTPEIYDRVATVRPGTDVQYTLRRGDQTREQSVRAQRFSRTDWMLLFGAFLLSGTAYLACGLAVWVLRPDRSLGAAFLGMGASWAFFLLTAMDLYGPGTFFRFHVLCETLVAPSVLQLALLFPRPHPLARWRLAGYVPSLVILAIYEVCLYRPAVYSLMLYANMMYLGLVSIFFGGRLVYAYWGGETGLARQRLRMVMLGTLAGFTVPGAIVLSSAVAGGGFAINLGVFTPLLFAVSVAYAIVKHDLFEIDAMVKRGAYYLVLTSAVGVTYVAAVVLFNVVLKAGTITDSGLFPVFFTLAVLLVLNPLRTRLQVFVDRVFFRTTYDAARVLAAFTRDLASSLKRDQIAHLVRDGVLQTIPNAGVRLFVAEDGTLVEVGGGGRVPPVLAERLSGGRLVTAFDPAELYAEPSTHEGVRTGLAALQAELAVPLQLRGELVGVLTAGAKRSGLFYTAGDAEFLQTLAHQAAIALENARSYEAVVELNTRLEERVRERTAQLEGANRELAEAYTELKQAETQLIHTEKMASLGRLVAGVAHEINNPVSFISTSIAPLRRRLTQAGALAPPSSRRALDEAEDLIGIMARGAERTAAIVKDLRSFSHLDEALRKSADLHEGLEVTLRLLEPRWRGRIEVHRDYGELPAVECDPGQMNQVFMNVIANACDAIRGEGNLWITTRALGSDVSITIRDDGPGIPAEVLAHVFDPFFTTKDVGAGSGLGLAISHTLIAKHGGHIEVDSRPGGGASFRITLPTVAEALAEAAAAR